jgi:hypothetical protein
MTAFQSLLRRGTVRKTGAEKPNSIPLSIEILMRISENTRLSIRIIWGAFEGVKQNFCFDFALDMIPQE